MSHISREFVKLLFQKRTYFGWVGLFLVPFIITVAIRFSHGGDGPGPDANQQGGDFFFNLVKANGLYVALGSLFVLVAFLLPLLASMAGSQTIAGEAENGTLRTVLMQPVRRGGLLLAKWFVANVYIAIGLVILIVGSLIAGGAVFGLKPLLLMTGEVVSTSKAIWLIVVSYAFVLLAMATVVSLAMVFSSLTNSGLTAVGAAMVLVIVMLILGNLSMFDFLKPYLFTHHFHAWTNFLREPIDWAPVRDALINFTIWIVGTLGIAWYVFGRKDILS